MDFILDNWTYGLIPIISGIVGWATNVLALRMTFYPLEFKGIPPYLGWQGIIPSKAGIMAGKAVNLFITVLAVTCLVITVINVIAGHIGSAYTVDHGRNIIVTANAPFLLAGRQIWAGINAGSPVWFGTDIRIINTVIGAER